MIIKILLPIFCVYCYGQVLHLKYLYLLTKKFRLKKKLFVLT